MQLFVYLSTVRVFVSTNVCALACVFVLWRCLLTLHQLWSQRPLLASQSLRALAGSIEGSVSETPTNPEKVDRK